MRRDTSLDRNRYDGYVTPGMRNVSACERSLGVGTIVAVLLALCPALPAQTPTGPPSSVNRDSKVTAQARRQLEIAALELSTVSPATQATVLLGLGRVCSRIDKRQSSEYLERAYELALRLGASEAPGIQVVQGDAVEEMARLDPDYVEQNLPTEPRLRDVATSQLVRHYAAKHAFERAIELIQTLEDPDWVAQDLMMAQPAHGNERNQVIAIVLNSYRQRGFVAPGRGTDLGTLLVRFWKDLRPQLVNEATDELLKQADPANADHNLEVLVGVSASSPAGTVRFANFYEFRLFQLLPILKVTDPTHAQALLRDNAQRAAVLAKYPDGQRSLDPTVRDTPLKEGEASEASYRILRSGDGAAASAAQAVTDRTVSDIVNSAGDAPERALARASAITDPRTRIRALLAIAGRSVDTAPDVARSALRLCLEAANAPPSLFVPAAQLYLKMKDPEGAKKAVQRGMAAAAALYKQDSDADDPNQAIRLLWPSVQFWRDLIDAATGISPEFAAALIDELPDDEAKPLERTFLACRWLNLVPWASTSPFVMHKARR